MKIINPKGKSTGFAIPLLSLRREGNPCGEFPDIAALARLARLWNMNVVQLLPLNDSGWQTSPYSALSAFALNPVYLRIRDLPELAGSPLSPEARTALDKAEALAAECGGRKRVPYAAILEGKLGILEALWRGLLAGEAGGRVLREVEVWAAANPWAVPYACFVELKRRFGGAAWWEWPALRDPDEAALAGVWNGAEGRDGLRFRVWLQMRAEEQFKAGCSAAGKLGVDIMGDIPILMNADSADVWFNRGLFDMDHVAGAPPDMYSRMGQNWGFPLYRWDEIERRGFSFWKDRLSYADKFYTMYRIDHVLGFFRIWAIGTREADGYLGRFIPEFSLSYPELDALGFDAGRIRWLSRPHVPQRAIEDAAAGLPPLLQKEILGKVFERIGNEPLYLFAPSMKGGADIAETVRALAADFRREPVSPEAITACVDSLLDWWRNRTFLECSPGQFVPTWEYKSSTAWNSLSDGEKGALEALIYRRSEESGALWEKTGRRILGTLTSSVAMQACAEDLGAVPPCVPEVLDELGIPGLRVLRWFREWAQPGAPFVPLEEYPERSVACMSVHDSTNLRQWWEEEADRNAVWAMAKKARAAAPCAKAPRTAAVPDAAPQALDPDSALFLLEAFAAARSRFAVYPLQDLMAASARHREPNPADERINVPGTTGDANWLYRMKPTLEELEADDGFASRMRNVAASRN